jgi:integrase/recombinase XerD
MSWPAYKKGFKAWLQLEKGLSANSIDAYLRDVDKLTAFLELRGRNLSPGEVDLKMLREFTGWIHEIGLSEFTHARIVSGVRCFYEYLGDEGMVDNNLADLLEAPRLSRNLPDVLHPDEIERIIKYIDLSSAFGHRNRAIIEILYSCGLRVSELTGLKISDIYFDEEFIRVIGKGNKERLIPAGKIALRQVKNYLLERDAINVAKSAEDILFLNNRGKPLSRVMIFLIIKKLAREAGVKKTISPHTFRHSFATVLVENGADLRAVQEMLGHSSITTTEIYTHLDRNYLKKVLDMYHPASKKKR